MTIHRSVNSANALGNQQPWPAMPAPEHPAGVGDALPPAPRVPAPAGPPPTETNGMTLRWQDVGERSHAVDSNRELRAHEHFRALCGRWCEVWPTDVHTRHRWLFWIGFGFMDHARRPPCTECDHIWDDMDELGTKQKVNPS